MKSERVPHELLGHAQVAEHLSRRRSAEVEQAEIIFKPGDLVGITSPLHTGLRQFVDGEARFAKCWLQGVRSKPIDGIPRHRIRSLDRAAPPLAPTIFR